MATRRKNPRTGGTVDSLWKKIGILEDVQELAVRKMLAAELEKAMSAKKWSKAELARRLRTSRPQIERLLNPASSGGLTVATLARAARVVGKRVKVSLVAA